MCMIAYQPSGNDAFPREVFTNAWSHNHHGAGYMFCHNGKVVIRKPFYKLRELIRAYEADHVQFGATSPFVVHFRWATHGTKEAVNVHPHPLDDGKAGLVHNGVLSAFTPPWKQNDLSDTAWFCRTVLVKRPAEQLVDQGFAEMLAEMITDSNKMVILSHTGRAMIINPKAGAAQYDGVRWYSNSDFKEKYKKAWVSTPTTSIGFLSGTGTTTGPIIPVTSQSYGWWADEKKEFVKPADDSPPRGPNECDSPDLYEHYEKTYNHLVMECYSKLHTQEDWDNLDRDAWNMAKDTFPPDISDPVYLLPKELR